MAKNKSIIKLEGTLGDITFYNKNGQNLAKLKSEVSKARIMKDPSFARTRENMSELEEVHPSVKAYGLLLQTSLKPLQVKPSAPS